MNARLRIIVYILGSCILAYALAWTYTRYIPEPRWIWIAVIHSVLAVILWKYAPRQSAISTRHNFRILAWLSGPIVLVSAFTLANLTRILQPEDIATATHFYSKEALLSILWIPFIEELLFRRAIGTRLRQRIGLMWGVYTSALIFAIVHSSPPLSWQAPLGPFLLALACELSYCLTGRLLPAVLLHAACNATPLIFAAIDPRWLTYLRILYLDL